MPQHFSHSIRNTRPLLLSRCFWRADMQSKYSAKTVKKVCEGVSGFAHRYKIHIEHPLSRGNERKVDEMGKWPQLVACHSGGPQFVLDLASNGARLALQDLLRCKEEDCSQRSHDQLVQANLGEDCCWTAINTEMLADVVTTGCRCCLHFHDA